MRQFFKPSCFALSSLDNCATHKTPQVKRWLKRHPRFHLHFTPTSSSWLKALDELDRQDPEAVELVQLPFFVGLTHEQAADLLGMSRSAPT